MIVPFDILDLVPQGLKQQALATLVDFVSGQAEKYASDEVAAKIKRLRPDAAFSQAFEEGLERAAQRFIEEYEIEDEDLVAAIVDDQDFFKNEEVLAATPVILETSRIYTVDEREVAGSLATLLPQRKNPDRVGRTVIHLLIRWLSNLLITSHSLYGAGRWNCLDVTTN